MYTLSKEVIETLRYIVKNPDENIKIVYARELLHEKMIIYSFHLGWTVTEKGKKYLKEFTR